jgi:formylglycine-generating enzyme required for sulfatase activity
LLLALQYGIVQDLRAAVGTRPPVLLLPQLVQKLRTRVPLDETAIRWAIEAWAEALGLHLPALLPSPPPPVTSSLPLLSAPLPTWRNSIGMEFVLIQPGEFSMGCSASEAYNNERPAHTVRLTNAFYLGKYEVTQGQWQQVIEHWRDSEAISTAGGASPARGADVFTIECEGRATVLPFASEAEWGMARAGTSTAYNFGNDPRQLDEYVWYRESRGQDASVGKRSPMPGGCMICMKCLGVGAGLV